MTSEEKLNNAVRILDIENDWSKKNGFENMYDYIVEKDSFYGSYQIRINGLIHRQELSKMQYQYLFTDNSSKYNLVIQF